MSFLSKKCIVLSVLSMMILTGCDGKMSKRDIGTATGAVAGGIIGSTIGGGAGRVISSVIGAGAGGYLGNKIGESMDETDNLKREVQQNQQKTSQQK